MSRNMVEVVPPTGLAWCHACHAAVEKLYYDASKVGVFIDAKTKKQYAITPALLCAGCAHISVDKRSARE